MTTSIYDLHDKAFGRVSAFVIVHGGARVATIAFKSPDDGSGRLYSYVHWLGKPMVRGFAGGYGYDKRSAACADAARKLEDVPDGAYDVARGAFRVALLEDGGQHWDSALRDAGFTVWQAV